MDTEGQTTSEMAKPKEPVSVVAQIAARANRERKHGPKTAAKRALRERLRGTVITPARETALEMRSDALRKRAHAAAARLVEHYPVDDSCGAPPRRPRTPDELVTYVEWALPLARKLGTRVTAAEARAIGFVHAG